MADSPVYFHRLATNEYVRAFDKYSQISNELAKSFKLMLERAVEKISADPAAWPRFGANFHWVKLRRFPYLLYYQNTDEGAEIIAVAHSRRRLGYWKGRRYYR